MGGNLEYTMSSLPYLRFRDSQEERTRVVSLMRKYAGVSEGEVDILSVFEAEARKFLTPKQRGILEASNLDQLQEPRFRKVRNRVLASFASYLYQLKQDLGELRIARRRGLETTAGMRPVLPLVPGSPLEEEVQLMRWQWEKLEELSIGHYADIGALCIYKLKLLLLQRLWDFDREQGFEKFESITKTH